MAAPERNRAFSSAERQKFLAQDAGHRPARVHQCHAAVQCRRMHVFPIAHGIGHFFCIPQPAGVGGDVGHCGNDRISCLRGQRHFDGRQRQHVGNAARRRLIAGYRAQKRFHLLQLFVVGKADAAFQANGECRPGQNATCPAPFGPAACPDRPAASLGPAANAGTPPTVQYRNRHQP